MRIVYNSFDGRYSDSPRALHEALLARGQRAEHVWLASPRHAAGFPAGVRTVPARGPEAVAELERADLVVSNQHLPADWRKGPGARYLQTWHGTPLKRIAADEPGAPAVLPAAADIARWDLLLSPNPPSTVLLPGAFRYDGPIATTGYPRNDALSAPDRDAVRARVRRRLGVGDDQVAVLYAPTWRDDVLDADGRRDVELHLDLARFAARLAPGHVLLLRLHYMVSERLGVVRAPGVVDTSAHPDIRELYLAADAMVTDYSSTMFDFAVTGKPLLFFAYDLEHYRDDVRGFYFDVLEHDPPGPVVRTSDELLDALADLPAVAARHARSAAAFHERFCALEDGYSSDRVLSRLFPGAPRRPAVPHPTRHLQQAPAGLREGGRAE